jgi:hypothetical protein
LKQDPKVAMAAIQRKPEFINEIPKELQNERFYTAAIIAIPGVEIELPFEVRQNAKQMEEDIQRPKKSFDQVVKWAKDQKTEMQQGPGTIKLSYEDREI